MKKSTLMKITVLMGLFVPIIETYSPGVTSEGTSPVQDRLEILLAQATIDKDVAQKEVKRHKASLLELISKIELIVEKLDSMRGMKEFDRLMAAVRSVAQTEVNR